MSTVADKLDEARALIEKGWCQDAYSENGCVCSLGAINTVTSGSPALEFRTGWNEMVVALTDAVGASSSADIPTWNDAPERTQAEVIDAFKRAAELARSKQVSA